ncbi:MAG: hypothetical protein M1376_21795 [Planctomycetes bacterium]|nr:hypothetical protein [Planctomycetota bacterium]
MKTHSGTMRNRQVARWLGRLFLGITLALTLLLACGVGVQKMHDGRIERAIDRYRAAPSAQGAARLTQWLAESSVTQEQGTRILTALLSPTIVTRAAYPVGQSVGISVERPFPITIRGYRIEFQEHIWGDGRLMDSSWQSRSTLYGFPEILTAWTEPAEPGVYHARIRTTCKITSTAGRRFTLWERLSLSLRKLLGRPPAVRGLATSPSTTYECRFMAPFDLHIVEKDRAERLELVADPETDKIMRAAIAAESSDRHGAYGTPAGRRGHYGSTNLTFKTLPTAGAFELSLRLTDGRELPAGPNRQPQRIRIRAGKSGVFVVNVGNFGITEPGEYAGTLVLRSDPNYAYEDPAIKSIWNGTLEFPMSFFVHVQTQTE